MPDSKKLPISIVTGFLGSGKTTLLQHVLRQQGMQDTAVLVNEFGKVGLDHHLLQVLEESTILLGGGCVCCSTRDDLVQGLTQLLNRVQGGKSGPVSRIVLETTGLADPAPILFTVLSHPVLQHHFSIHNVIVTVDAVNGLFHLRHQPESVKQAMVADKFILTKTDLAPVEEVSQLLNELQSINRTAEIHTAVHGSIDDTILFSPPATVRQRTSGAVTSFQEKGTHVQDVSSVSVTFQEPLDWTAFGLWLSMLLHAKGEEIMRVKGMLDIGGQGPVVLNGVQHIIHPPEHLQAWPSEERVSRLVFIMRGVHPDDILASLEAFQVAFGEAHNMPVLEVL